MAKKPGQPDLHHHQLVYLHQGIEVTLGTRTPRILKLDLLNLCVAVHKEVIGVLHVTKCGGNYLEACHDRSNICFKGNITESSSVAPIDRAGPRGAIFGTKRGTNNLHAIT
ncbi:hypothetical protein H5410_014797, partial [Solanum commersonii]